jgi:hypothetical protein
MARLFAASSIIYLSLNKINDYGFLKQQTSKQAKSVTKQICQYTVLLSVGASIFYSVSSLSGFSASGSSSSEYLVYISEYHR